MNDLNSYNMNKSNINNFSDLSLYLYLGNDDLKSKNETFEKYLQEKNKNNQALFQENEFLLNFLLPQNIEYFGTDYFQVLSNFNMVLRQNPQLRDVYRNLNDFESTGDFTHCFAYDHCLFSLLTKYDDIDTLSEFLNNININLIDYKSYSLSSFNTLDDAYDSKMMKDSFYSDKNNFFFQHSANNVNYELLTEIFIKNLTQSNPIYPDSFINLFAFNITSDISKNIFFSLNKKLLSTNLDEHKIDGFYQNAFNQFYYSTRDDKLINQLAMKLIDSITPEQIKILDVLKRNMSYKNNLEECFKDSLDYLHIKQEKHTLKTSLNLSEVKENIRKRI